MRRETRLTPEQMLNDIKLRPTVPLWPHAAWAHGLNRPGAYAAARRGDIVTLQMGRRRPALTGPLRRKLQIESE
jgi:propanediol utilization protein